MTSDQEEQALEGVVKGPQPSGKRTCSAQVERRSGSLINEPITKRCSLPASRHWQGQWYCHRHFWSLVKR